MESSIAVFLRRQLAYEQLPTNVLACPNATIVLATNGLPMNCDLFAIGDTEKL